MGQARGGRIGEGAQARWTRAFAIALAMLLDGGRASAITISDVTDPAYVTGDSAFTGVAKIIFDTSGSSGPFLCSGSLISPLHVLTAGHCVNDALGWAVTFETPSGTATIGTVDADVHPFFRPRPDPFPQLDEYDVGVLTLAAPAPADAQIYGLKLDDSGLTDATLLDLVGYGLGGNPTDGFLPAGTRRHAVNSAIATSDPDQPLVMAHIFLLGSLLGQGQLGLIAAGDSGSPALFGDLVVGVGSFSNVPRPPENFPEDLYFSGHANLFDQETGSWVASFIRPVPEPSTGALLLAALFCLGCRVRRRRAAARSAKIQARRPEYSHLGIGSAGMAGGS